MISTRKKGHMFHCLKKIFFGRGALSLTMIVKSNAYNHYTLWLHYHCTTFWQLKNPRGQPRLECATSFRLRNLFLALHWPPERVGQSLKSFFSCVSSLETCCIFHEEQFTRRTVFLVRSPVIFLLISTKDSK